MKDMMSLSSWVMSPVALLSLSLHRHSLAILNTECPHCLLPSLPPQGLSPLPSPDRLSQRPDVREMEKQEPQGSRGPRN